MNNHHNSSRLNIVMWTLNGKWWMCWVNVLCMGDHIVVVYFLHRCSAIPIERLRILLSSSGCSVRLFDWAIGTVFEELDLWSQHQVWWRERLQATWNRNPSRQRHNTSARTDHNNLHALFAMVRKYAATESMLKDFSLLWVDIGCSSCRYW